MFSCGNIDEEEMLSKRPIHGVETQSNSGVVT